MQVQYRSLNHLPKVVSDSPTAAIVYLSYPENLFYLSRALHYDPQTGFPPLLMSALDVWILILLGGQLGKRSLEHGDQEMVGCGEATN